MEESTMRRDHANGDRREVRFVGRRTRVGVLESRLEACDEDSDMTSGALLQRSGAILRLSVCQARIARRVGRVHCMICIQWHRLELYRETASDDATFLFGSSPPFVRAVIGGGLEALEASEKQQWQVRSSNSLPSSYGSPTACNMSKP